MIAVGRLHIHMIGAIEPARRVGPSNRPVDSARRFSLSNRPVESARRASPSNQFRAAFVVSVSAPGLLAKSIIASVCLLVLLVVASGFMIAISDRFGPLLVLVSASGHY